jgi:hypothetical protein
MVSPARKPATYEDLLQLPDDKIGEIVDGELYASPRPAVPPSWPTRHGGSWVLAGTHAADALVRGEPFDAVEIDLLRLWGEERPTRAE